MHDMLDTEDADAAAERYWSEGYKEIIRDRLGQIFAEALLEVEAFRSVYEDQYSDRFSHYNEFVNQLAEMVVIGAENGTDEVFDEIYASFRADAPLPEPHVLARYFWPEPFSEDLKNEVHRKVFEEYRNHHAYVHIYEDHYQGAMDFDGFINQVADLVVVGAVNGTDDALGNIYRSFLTASPLPPARRRPRRIR